MKYPVRVIALMMVLTLAAGALGGWLGVAYGERAAGPSNNLHHLVHQQLNLFASQTDQIAALEAQYAARRQSLETEMRAANRDLANALNDEHAYGPRAQAAIDRFHRAEAQLEEATIRHIMAMRSILNAKQSKQFDHVIYEALTADSK